MFSKIKIESYLRRIENQLFRVPRQRVKFSEKWFQEISSDSGIYGIFQRKKLIYIGETGSLRNRMRDLGRTVNHQFRRSLGKDKFANLRGFKVATSKRKFPPKFEVKLNTWIEGNLKIAIVPLSLGRKEFEEYICKNHKPRFNRKGQRT